MKKLLILLLVLFVVACKQNDTPIEEIKLASDETKVIKKVTTDKAEAIKEINDQMFCTKDLKICPNGNSVSRNPKLKCEFDSCSLTTTNKKPSKKEPMMCTADAKECPDGSFVGRDHYNNCKFKACPNETMLKDKI